MKIGVLAVQGAFAAHARALRKLEVEVVLVRTPRDLEGLAGVVLPGGESGAHIRILRENGLLEALRRFEGASFGTCAGLILLARRVTSPAQESLGKIDVDVARNAYGRQRESFETEDGRVFIRAPRITRVGPGVEVLSWHRDEPVAVREGRVLGACYHPELGDDLALHRSFLEACEHARRIDPTLEQEDAGIPRKVALPDVPVRVDA